MIRADAAANPFPTHTLANGLRIVAQPMGGVESLALGFCIATGARDEAPAEAGSCHFIDGLAYQSTAQRDARALTEAFEDLGARHDAGAGVEIFWYTAQALGRHLEALVPLLAEVVRQPRFDAQEAEKVRDRLLQDLAAVEDEPMRKVQEVLQREFFQEHPYGHNVLGTDESIRALTTDDLRAYWARTHLPNNTILAAAGKLEFDRLVQAVEAACGDWAPGTIAPLPEAPSYGSRIRILHRESNQQHIAMALPGVPVGDPDYYAVAMLSTILGGGMNSRLFNEVREKRGLAYGVSASASSLRDGGMLRIYAGTEPARAPETIAVILEELRKLQADGVSDDELERAKTYVKCQVIMRSERTAVRRNVIGSSLWYEGKIRTLDQVRAEIEAVTVEQIRAVATRLGLTTQLTVVAIGPRSAEELLPNEH